MHHKRIYDLIIERGQKRGLPRKKQKGLERHHIVPRSLGGTDENPNLVDLTPREHFICHWLLYKIHGGAMAHAFWMMSNTRAVTSTVYALARAAHAKVSSGYTFNRGRKHSLKSRQNFKSAMAKRNMRGVNNPMYGRATNGHQGRSHSQKTKIKLSALRLGVAPGNKGASATPEQRAKSSFKQKVRFENIRASKTTCFAVDQLLG